MAFEFIDNFVNKLQQDPAFNQAILNMGASLLQPVQPGQTGAGHFGQALMGSVAHLNKMREASALQKIRERTVGAQETTAGAAATRAATDQRALEEYQLPQVGGINREREARANLYDAQARREKLFAEMGKGTKLAPEMIKNLWGIATASVGMTDDMINELAANGKFDEIRRLEAMAMKRFNNLAASMGYPTTPPLLEHISPDYLRSIKPGSEEEKRFMKQYGDAGQQALTSARTPPKAPSAPETKAGGAATAGTGGGTAFNPTDRLLTKLEAESPSTLFGAANKLQHLKEIVAASHTTAEQKRRAAALIPKYEARVSEMESSLDEAY